MAKDKVQRFRIYVIYGQYGFAFSSGMYLLARRIAKEFPDSYVTTHSWKYPGEVVNDWRAMPVGVYKPILIGYSLGANEIPRIAYGIKQQIPLAVMYDPSIYGERTDPFPPHVKRALLYHNVGETGYGHLIMESPQIERTDVNTSHLLVCYRNDLHDKTIAAIKAEAEASSSP